MKLRFYIDRETDLPHIYNHDVQEVEVEDVLRKPGEDRPGKENSRIVIGQTKAGRYLRVIYVPYKIHRWLSNRINPIFPLRVESLNLLVTFKSVYMV